MSGLLAQTGSSAALGAVLFWACALTVGGSALGVVISRNIVRTAVCLMFTLLGVAGLYFLLAAEFLAAVQLVVYAGGTLILIIFGVMLTNKSPFAKLQAKPMEVAGAVAIAVVLMVAMCWGIVHVKYASHPLAGGVYAMDKLGVVLLGDFLIPFEIISVLLLLVMIGAAYLAKGRRAGSDVGSVSADAVRAGNAPSASAEADPAGVAGATKGARP
jgi:NADH-quinone oxidoreductase subunit J